MGGNSAFTHWRSFGFGRLLPAALDLFVDRTGADPELLRHGAALFVVAGSARARQAAQLALEQRLLGERRAGQLLANFVRTARNMHIVEVALRAVEFRHRQQRFSDGCGVGGFLESRILRAVVANIVIGGNHQPRRRELAAHQLRDRRASGRP